MGDKAIASKLEKLRLEQQEAGDEDREEDGDEDEEEEFGEPFRPLNKFEIYRMRALQKIDQVRAETIEVEYEKERVALEAKYIALRQPLVDDRAQILAGTKAVPQEDDEETAGLPGEKIARPGSHRTHHTEPRPPALPCPALPLPLSH